MFYNLRCYFTRLTNNMCVPPTYLFSKWLQRDSNSCYLREREVSLPLDYGAICSYYLTSSLSLLRAEFRADRFSHAWSPLTSYCHLVAGIAGFEPATSRLTAVRSNRWTIRQDFSSTTKVKHQLNPNSSVRTCPKTEVYTLGFVIGMNSL